MEVVYTKIEDDKEMLEFLPHLMEKNKPYYGKLSNGMIFMFYRNDNDDIRSFLQVGLNSDLIDGKPHQLRQFAINN